jgi:hypothetical protein
MQLFDRWMDFIGLIAQLYAPDTEEELPYDALCSELRNDWTTKEQ